MQVSVQTVLGSLALILILVFNPVLDFSVTSPTNLDAPEPLGVSPGLVEVPSTPPFLTRANIPSFLPGAVGLVIVCIDPSQHVPAQRPLSGPHHLGPFTPSTPSCYSRQAEILNSHRPKGNLWTPALILWVLTV